MPRVSVILPAYNAEPFLGETLDSVLRQTYTDWEVVVVDDGSTDKTRAIIDERAADFQGRLRYFFQQNLGVSGARNAAIAASRGKFLAFLDADDIWLEKRLELGVDARNANPSAGLVHAQVVHIDRSGKTVGRPAVPPEKYLSGRISPDIYTRRAHILTPTVLVRRSCLDAAGYFDETFRVTEDRDLWFRIACLFDVIYLKSVVACYRVSRNSLSRDWETSRVSQIRFLEKHHRAGFASVREYRQGLANVHRERGDVLFNRGELLEAIRWYREAVSYDVRNFRNVYMLLRALGEPLIGALRRTAQSAESKA